MKIAVTHEDGNVFQHFGHTEEFKIYEVANGKIVSSALLKSNGTGHGALAGVLKDNGVEILICGGIGGGAKSALAEAGIKLYGGVVGSCDSVVNALLGNRLKYNANVRCDHHGEGHTCGDHADGHSCGDHGCGGHGCH